MAQAELDALATAIAKMEAEIDTLAPENRREKMRAFRSDCGFILTDEDEKVISLFEEGVLDFRHLTDHFHGRLSASPGA